ncbi:MAG: LPS-assembly lipoprotein [Candidatus Tokpelaia sp. JSC085]|nr:MAG: LPS-assembly lipoprotein [Candidatus Tokpelaia sp. JSC085]
MGILLKKLLLYRKELSILSFKRTISNIVEYSAVISLLLMLTACTIQPLYSSGKKTVRAIPDIRKELFSVAIESPTDHITLLVRNHLIYLLSGDSGQSASPAYTLKLNVSSHIQQAVHVNIGDGTNRGGRPSAGRVIATAGYVLKDIQGKILFVRRTSVTSSFDRPRQEYANLQAEQDAKNRAAEELAERIFLSIAINFRKF